MANPELGAKQICPNCQAKFYDLGKRPAHCPKCDTEFDPEEAVKTRRSRTRSATPDYDRDDAAEKPAPVDPDAEELEEADDTPELDQVVDEPIDDEDDDTATPGAAPADPDLGVGIEEEDADLAADDDDVPFLEDEDDDDAFDEDIEGIPNGDEDR